MSPLPAVVLHGARPGEWIVGGEREVEIVVNGHAVAKEIVPADGQLHALEF